MPAVWCGEPLPQHLSRDEAIAYASGRAVERQRIYILIWSRKEEIVCGPDGIAGPYTTLGGHGGKQGFVFG